MRSFGYLFLFLAFIGAGIIWQILRRVSASTQAFINPERYAIGKVVEMQGLGSFPIEKWNALVKYDPQIVPIADQLRPFGEKWVWTLGRDYFALQEDRAYLPHMLHRLLDEAVKERNEAEKKAEETKEVAWSPERSKVRRLYDENPYDESSVAILSEAQKRGYILTIEPSGTIAAGIQNKGTSFLRSNSDVERFGRYMGHPKSFEVSSDAIAVLRKAKDKGYTVAFSPDKSSIVVSSRDGWRASLRSNQEVLKFGLDIGATPT
jgi:hypothetical protein